MAIKFCFLYKASIEKCLVFSQTYEYAQSFQIILTKYILETLTKYIKGTN